MNEDPLEQILGKKLYEELNNLDESVTRAKFLIEGIDEATLHGMIDTEYGAYMPFNGKLALDLLGALHHAATKGCTNCETFVMRFAGNVIGNMWVDILTEEGLIQDEQTGMET